MAFPIFGVSHTPEATFPRQREVVILDWTRVAKIVMWPIVVTLMILSILYMPLLWGCQYKWIGTGNGGWSLANEGGVMPLSLYYIKKCASYSVGDIVSFEYRAGATAQENGPSIKKVTSINPDGSYNVAGLNEFCSVPPCNVPAADIRGKIIAGPVSVMPTAYWRWLSLGWTLNVDEIAVRGERIFSMETLKNAFSEDGRAENWVTLTENPSSFIILGKGFWVKQNLESKSIYIFSKRSCVYESKGMIENISPVQYKEFNNAGWVVKEISVSDRDFLVKKVKEMQIGRKECAVDGVKYVFDGPINGFEKAIDGDTKSPWVIETNENTVVVFSEKKINKVRLIYSSYILNIESSNDGDAWSIVNHFEGPPSNGWSEFKIPDTKYIKISLRGSNPSLPKCLYELEVTS